MRILHLDTNHPALWDGLAALGCTNIEGYSLSKEAVMAQLPSLDGLIIRSRFPIDQTFLNRADSLRFIARVGAGLENIDMEAARSRGISLIAAPEGNRNAVGEHTLGLLLSLFNKLHTAHNQVQSGLWQREKNRGIELDGKTVGIIGYGNMGKAFAKKLRGFDCTVIFHDIREGLTDENARQVPLETLQQQADVLSLHIPWTPATDRLVDARFIAAFSKPFWLLNTARGKCVVTADLVAALETGKILGAGLDVLEYEKSSFESLFETDELPQPLIRLLQMEKVLLSPHVAGWTVESHQKLAETIVEKVKKQFFS